MKSPAHDIALFLEANGIGTFATDLFVGVEPASPDDVVTIYDTAGGPPGHIGIDLRSPTIQVRVRGVNYPAAYALQEQIYQFLAVETKSFETSEYRYIGAAMTSDILSIGRDENNRYLLTCNYQLERQPVEVAP